MHSLLTPNKLWSYADKYRRRPRDYPDYHFHYPAENEFPLANI